MLRLVEQDYQLRNKDAVIAVPVDPTATSATLTLKFSSNNNNRYVYVGDKSGENAVICLNTAGREELPNAVNINGDKEATVTVSSAALRMVIFTYTRYTCKR